MADDRLVLEYKRKISEGGKCSGRVVRYENDEPSSTLFADVSFKEMLEVFAWRAQRYPDLPLFYKRIDHLGFEEQPWDPAHVASFRGDSAKVIEELSTPRVYGKELKNG
jgi:hypothetical protein